jgi:hypothetical protein
MIRGSDEGMAEALLADVSSVVLEVEVAMTMLDCGTSAVAVSVPVGLMLWGAEVETSDVVASCGVTDGVVEEMVELLGEVAAVSTAGDSVEVLVGGTVAVVLDVAGRSVGAELAVVDPVSGVTDALADEGAAESSTDCAEDTTDSIEDATEAADDSADVIDETPVAAAVSATDSRELATDNTDVAAEPADDRTDSADDVMEAAEPRLVDKPIVMPVLVEVGALPAPVEVEALPASIEVGALPAPVEVGALPAPVEVGALPALVEVGALPSPVEVGALPSVSEPAVVVVV